MQAFDVEAAEFAQSVHQILVYAASSVRTLTLMCYDVHIAPKDGMRWGVVFGEEMPRLEEVTIRGGFHEGEIGMRDLGEFEVGGGERMLQLEGGGHLIPGPGNADAASDTSGPKPSVDATARLPSLKRLHLISPTPFEPFIRKLQPLAPSLSHIRLSDLQATDYTLARTLFSELVERDIVPSVLPGLHEHQWSSIPTALPIDWMPLLPRPDIFERLVLQPYVLPSQPDKICGCCSGYYQMDDMTRLLREMARMSEGGAFVFVPADCSRRDAAALNGFGRYSYEEALRSWRYRACDVGDGCWKERGEVDIDVAQTEDAGDETEEEEMLVWKREWSVDRSVLRRWSCRL